MNKYRFLLISLVAILASSCVKDNIDNAGVVSQEAVAAKKIINTSTDADPGSLIFYVTEECAERLENAEVTRSGMSEIDLLAMDIEATSIQPVFNLKVNAERKRAMGMHRWYVVSFPTHVALDDAAMKLASIDYVETVQFSRSIKRPTDQPVVVDPAMSHVTRSEEFQFDDPGLYYQWHYINKGLTSLFPTSVEGEDINAKSAWKLTAGRPEIIVAVVDEGVCYTHEDLKDNMLVNEAELNGTEGVDDDENGYVDDIYGYNFASKDGRNGKISWNDMDDIGHGTHVAGTVAAVNNNGKGCAGVAGGTGNGDGVRILSAQIMSGKVAASYDETARAIEYAADRGASVLQCSWGFEPNTPGVSNDNEFSTGIASVEYQALQYFVSTKNCDAVDGGIVVFAAGNEGMAAAGYPGAYRDFVCVTAFAPDGLPAYYTCYDKGCNISAPGGEYFTTGASINETGCVYSTLPNNKYGYMQGTSMACPHVSGVVALGLSYALDLGKTFTLDEFKSLLLTSVNAFDNSLLSGSKYIPGGGTLNLTGYRNKMGTGKIDAYRLLMAIRGVDCVPVSSKQTTYIDFNKFMGNDKLNLKIKDYNIPDETREALGIEFDQLIGGQFTIQATKAGVGTMKVGMIAGGTAEGGGLLIGGMYIEKEFALIARPDVELDDLGAPVQSNGWL
ncbi:MAG: S8 family serine peptidase [Alistipes sp.]|nr:S8 family serine peptidase [Alistipes sp.]